MTKWLALIGVAMLLAVFVGYAVQIGPWVKRCEQVAWDVVISYNGGCEDPNVPVENQDDFRDSNLKGDLRSEGM